MHALNCSLRFHAFQVKVRRQASLSPVYDLALQARVYVFDSACPGACTSLGTLPRLPSFLGAPAFFFCPQGVGSTQALRLCSLFSSRQHKTKVLATLLLCPHGEISVGSTSVSTVHWTTHRCKKGLRGIDTVSNQDDCLNVIVYSTAGLFVGTTRAMALIDLFPCYAGTALSRQASSCGVAGA